MDEQAMLEAVYWPAELHMELGQATWTARGFDHLDATEASDSTQVRITREARRLEILAFCTGRSGESNTLAMACFAVDRQNPQVWNPVLCEVGDPPRSVPWRVALSMIDSLREELDPQPQFQSAWHFDRSMV